ncbi:MAG TPA: AraC family transcriptional regulator [Paraburkholderia sp.]|jgi:AraC-like DNA-binding protein|uniref:helix-turn-helix transcriptional regulator n=1 Tax=Paraburkholderia sp. TaxID=1926495 RepID=UPI002DE91241|nr:AraC family transcriptional regulator [Paraburkholderia sp.]
MSEYVHYQQVSEVPGLVLSTARFAEFSFDRHFHLDFHVGLVSEGIQRQGSHGSTVLLGPGRIALMPPGEIHDGMAEDGGQYTLKTFRLSQELVASVAGELSGRPRAPELGGTVLDDPVLAGRLVRLHDTMHDDGGAGSLDVQTQWLTLLESLLCQSRAIVPERVPGALSAGQWSRVRDYCFSRLAEKITLEELAGLCGLGRFQFLKQFKLTIGMTPHAWLLRLRLERACELLLQGPQPIASVAQAVGFYDQSHFNRAFRQAYGVAPSCFRA